MNERNKISNFKCNNELNMDLIISEYSNYLYKVIENICANYMQAEDIEEIILDVFIALWKNKDKLDDDKNIKPYLASIAHNLTKKRLSSPHTHIKLLDIEDNTDYSSDIDIIESKFNTDKLNEILNSLSYEDYEIFTRFYYYSKKTKEIAKELDISDIKVKTKLHRLRNKIKKDLKERGYGI